MKHVDFKVPDGKMLKIDVEVKDNVVKEIDVRGDFFIHPEDSLKDLEETLSEIQIDDVDKKFKEWIDSKDVEVIGFDGKDLKTAVSKSKDSD
ncbi:MAG: hypothetical protein ACLFQ8_02840 [Candidatus Aenigmatarchaeota archaeon]